MPINFYFSIKIFLGKFIFLLIINNDNFKQLFIIINKNVINYLKCLFVYIRDRSFYAEHSYFRVYTHVNLYCAGVFVGYFLAKNQHFKMSRVSILLLLFIDFLSNTPWLILYKSLLVMAASQKWIIVCYRYIKPYFFHFKPSYTNWRSFNVL